MYLKISTNYFIFSTLKVLLFYLAKLNAHMIWIQRSSNRKRIVVDWIPSSKHVTHFYVCKLHPGFFTFHFYGTCTAVAICQFFIYYNGNFFAQISLKFHIRNIYGTSVCKINNSHNTKMMKNSSQMNLKKLVVNMHDYAPLVSSQIK